ncbi:OmpW family outer membrane protein [uncultured Microbulbifer sp.]|uniref:OmpW/AlkL family protein n=1 Tax=uncultured Microbulbifer sp. TaxID=348147 RepID=UPI00262DC55A|nr:OmpW family outer membrane protein [uncultured Microbulbifer sp.]
MKKTRVLTPLAIAFAAMVSAQQASADWLSDGDFIVRVGASWVDPDDSRDDLRFSDDFIHEDFDIDADTTWNISGAWLPVEHWGVELMYIGSTNHDMDLKRIGYAGDYYDIDKYTVGDFDASYSNAYLNWYPLSRDCMGQPYIGIGLNYTDFNDVSLSNDFRDDLNDLGLTNFDNRMTHSWGFTGQFGVDFKFGHESAFLVNAAVLYIDADTDYRFSYTDNNFQPSERFVGEVTDIDYSPWVFNLGVGYSF